jgi:hypothetical protein
MPAGRVPIDSLRLPPGFRLRVRGAGRDLGGFADVEDQETAIFTRGSDHREFNEALRISVTVSSEVAPLIGSGERPGAEVPELRSAVASTYQDGMWSLYDGVSRVDPADMVVAGQGVKLYWDRSVAHSITTATTAHRYGVFASKNYVSYAELVAVAQSLIDSEP